MDIKSHNTVAAGTFPPHKWPHFFPAVRSTFIYELAPAKWKCHWRGMTILRMLLMAKWEEGEGNRNWQDIDLT
jgi:hypothetical protein